MCVYSTYTPACTSPSPSTLRGTQTRWCGSVRMRAPRRRWVDETEAVTPDRSDRPWLSVARERRSPFVFASLTSRLLPCTYTYKLPLPDHPGTTSRCSPASLPAPEGPDLKCSRPPSIHPTSVNRLTTTSTRSVRTTPRRTGCTHTPTDAMTAPAGHRMEDLVLVPMTDAQWTKSHEYQYTFWGSGLSLPQFEERERRFCLESEFARQGNYKRW